MTARHHALLLGALLAIGCSDTTAPALKLNGTWITDSKVVGPIYSMTLDTRENLVKGTGDWFAEGCCSGTLTLSGTVDGDDVRLFLVQTKAGDAPSIAPFVQVFEGRLVGRSMLSGTLTLSGVRGAHAYRKVK